MVSFTGILELFSRKKWPFLLCKIKKKILPVDPQLWGCATFWPKMTHVAKSEFFKKPVHEPCFFYSCLSTYQKSKSFINLLVKYWWLKDTEISLAESHLSLTWELDFSEACSFRRMLMNHNNFDFTQIPDKTNDMIFLKSPKTIFLGHFWSFLPDGNFSKNLAVIQNYIWPLTLN